MPTTETFNETDLPAGTPTDPSVEAKPNQSADQDFNDFDDFDNPSLPVADEAVEPSTTDVNDTTETSGEAASTDDSVPATEDSDAPTSADTPVETEADPKDALIEQQRLQLLEMTRVLGESRKEPEVPSEPTPVTLEDVDFIGEDEEFHTAESLNKLLNTVLAKAVNEAQSQTMKVLPGAIAPQIKNAAAATARANLFLAENKDLVPHIPYVKYTMDQINSEGGSKTFDDVYKELETRVRAGLQINKGKTRQKSEPTGFAGTTGTRKPKAQTSALQSDIDAL